MRQTTESIFKKNWLHGFSTDSIIQKRVSFARVYFSNWDENDIKQCWRDLESVLNDCIKNQTKTIITQLNHFIILSLPGFLIDFPPFIQFLKKWIIKLEGSRKSTKDKPLNIMHILMSLFIIKNAANEDIVAVIDASELLTYWSGRLELESNPTEEMVNRIKSEIAKKRAKTPRPSQLNKLIVKILKNKPNFTYQQVRHVLKKEIGKGTILEVSMDLIKWVTADQTPKEINVKNGLRCLVNRIKKSIA